MESPNDPSARALPAGASKRPAAAAGRERDARRPRHAISLSTKLSVGIVALIAAVTLTLGIWLAEAARENLVESKRAAATAFADLFAASVAPAVDFRDEETLQLQAKHFRSRPDSLSLVVWVPDQPEPILRSVADTNAPLPVRPTLIDRSVQTLPDRVVVIRPVEGPIGVIGTARFSFSLAAENEAYRVARQRILVSILALGAALAGVILVLLRLLVTSPLRDLTSAVKLLQDGEHATVRVRANDEVGTLAAAFNAMAATIADREQKVATAYRELEEVSLTDPLTGLRNRRFFAETVRQETARSLRRHSQAAETQPRNRDIVVLLADLDLFKRVNDTYGHGAGDEVLRETGRRLLQTMRQSDFVLRWGGEEFLIVARDTERQDAPIIASRLLVAIGATPYQLEDGTSLHVTCSLGWAPYPWNGESDLDLERLIQLADRALYHAKHTGRNRAIGVQPLEGKTGVLRDLSDEPLAALDGKSLSLRSTVGPESEGQEPARPSRA